MLKVAARLQVFFIDETGHEAFADKNYPVFGLGGAPSTAHRRLPSSQSRGAR
jgi:hypothetical protein